MKKLLQSPWVRIVIATLFVGAGLAISQIALNLLRSAFSIANTAVASLLAFLLFIPIPFLTYWIYVRCVERRALSELGIKGSLRELGLGSLAGFGLFSFVILTLWVCGYYRVSGSNFALLSLAGALAGALASAFPQELIFRGVLYRITEEWLGTWPAVAISALLFGLIHLSSAGATLLSALEVALQAGILFAAAYALTHRLWLAFGLHALWDFANDGIFGVGVAGQSGQTLPGLLQASLNGPELVTGGALGVEASLVSLAIVLTAGIFMLGMIRRRGLIV